jgi:DNA mismatch repair protein MutL
VPPGTSVSVADLFYCVPARRKFLKSETTELGHIASLATHYALAHPDRHILLKTPSQEILNAAPVGQIAERVYQVFGRQALAELLEIPPAEGPMLWSITEPEREPEEAAAKLRVTGFTSRPDVQRNNRNGIYLFVNRRLVRDKLLLHAIHEAYRNIQPPGVFPCVLLFLELPYQEVDVNVHPAKIEVRFRHPQFVHDFARDAVRHALGQTRPIAGFPSGHGTAVESGTESQPPNAPMANATANIAATVVPGNGAAGATLPVSLGDIAALAGGFELSGAPDIPYPQRFPFKIASEAEMDAGRQESLVAAASVVTTAAAQSESPATLPRPDEIADLKPLGQVRNSFIVAINAEGLWIIDQHVAHERVLFEQHLRARHAGTIGGQRLLIPIIVELTPRQFAIFGQIEEELHANGFEAEDMGGRSVAIQAAPAGISGSDAERLLYEILDGAGRESQAISMETLQGQIAASTACHAAIKINMPLDRTKMEWLLAELARTEYPMSCPHGRPIVLRYSLRDIERAFHRI